MWEIDAPLGRIYDTIRDETATWRARLVSEQADLRLIRILAIVLFVISIPVALVTTNIRFVANEERVYRYAIDQFDAVETTGLEREELLRASAEIRAYFNNDAHALDIRVRQDGQEVRLFNERETLHMVDVKDRFRAVSRAQELSVLYALAFIAAAVLWSREVTTRTLALLVAVGSVICLVAIGLMVAIGLAGFDQAWEDFHRVMFSNDFWLLNPASDRLIQMFPPPFWESIVFFLGTLIAAEAILLMVGSGIYIGASRHRAARRAQTRYV
jgi:integral membrane protein (TIGR01906 family)